MTVVELVWWSSTDEFLADVDNLFKPTVDHVSAAPGCLKTYYGVEVEDRTNFWMVVVWQSHAHHQAMMDRPDYSAMVGRLKPYLRTQELYMRHVQFNSRHFDDSHLNNSGSATAFDAPVSAILFLTPRMEAGDQVQESVSEAIKKVTDTASDSNTGPPSVWGAAEEDAKETILVIGRKDVDEVNDSAGGAGSSPYSEALSGLSKVATIQAVHIRLRPGCP